MRAALLLCLAALAGCTAADAPEGWTFLERDADGAAHPLAEDASFATLRTLPIRPGFPQANGEWRGALEPGREVLMTFHASAPTLVEFRAYADASTSVSGRCNWDANETAQKELPLGTLNMRSTETTCRISFTPSARLVGEPSLAWGAKARAEQPDGWTLSFRAD